jgi:hypothetical protein
MKTMEKNKIGAHSLTCSTFEVRRACWSSRMKTRMSDKQINYSYRFAQTKQQVGYCIVGALLVHERTTRVHRLRKLTTT